MRVIILYLQLISSSVSAGELIPTLVPVNGGYDIIPADSRKKDEPKDEAKTEKESYWLKKNETRDGYTIELK